MKTVDFFGFPVTRMIVGDNPVNGHSYIPDYISGVEMNDWYTHDRIVEMFFNAENAGFNTILPLASPKTMDAMREYYKKGGTMRAIFQPYPRTPIEENIQQMLEFDPLAIYHQGTTTDYLVETDQTDILRGNLEAIKKTGLPVGLSSHVPETILMAEDQNFGIDFYMACLYNSRRNRRGQQSGFITGATKSDLIFYPEDRFLMYDVVKKIQKPCIVYKILAGGQVLYGKKPEEYCGVVKKYVKEAFDNIKPCDLTCIGVFQRDTDQVKQNAEIVSQLLGA